MSARDLAATVLLEKADEELAAESGMVVCWHEYEDDDILDSGCVQCLVEAALVRVAALEKQADLEKRSVDYLCDLIEQRTCALLTGGKQAAMEWAFRRDWFYVMDLANHLGVSPTHANNYVHELCELGLLAREVGDGPVGGGRRFRYSAAAAIGFGRFSP